MAFDSLLQFLKDGLNQGDEIVSYGNSEGQQVQTKPRQAVTPAVAAAPAESAPIELDLAEYMKQNPSEPYDPNSTEQMAPLVRQTGMTKAQAASAEQRAKIRGSDAPRPESRPNNLNIKLDEEQTEPVDDAEEESVEAGSPKDRTTPQAMLRDNYNPIPDGAIAYKQPESLASLLSALLTRANATVERGGKRLGTDYK